MEYDKENFKNRKIIVCGSDEAGRGPLAGPVVVSSVVLPEDFPIEILNDSKKMSEKNRLIAEKIIKEKALYYSIKRISHKIIDEINILNASLLGMEKSSKAVFSFIPFDILLVDGNKRPNVPFKCEAIIKGDSIVPEIMAASILSKCERDRIMKLSSLLYPEYGFEKHKGYPTKEHYEALKKYGKCKIHRESFNLKLENNLF